MKMNEITVPTTTHTQFVNIDRKVEEAIAEAGIKDGICHVFVPHTTAGLTINENADPDVVADIIQALERAVPWNASYAHGEGNAAAHVKASMMGFSQTVAIHGGRLAFGTCQSLYFCEFDGPRTRKVWVQCIPQLALRIPTIPPCCSEGRRPVVPKDSGRVFRVIAATCSE